MHALGRIAEEVGRKHADNVLRIGIDEVGDAGLHLFGQLLADNDCCAQLDGLSDESMTVNLRASHGHEGSALSDAAAIDFDARHFLVDAAHDALWFAALYELLEIHYL